MEREISYETFYFYGLTDAIPDEWMLIELVRYKSKLPFEYYKEIILNYRKILPTLNIQKIQDYALLAPKSNKVLEILQMEVF